MAKKRKKGKQMRRTLAPRHEMALNYFYGISNFNKTDALRRAGYKSPKEYLHLFAREDVKAAMAAREEETRERYAVDYDNLMRELMRVAVSSPFDFLEFDEDGNTYVDLEKLTAEQARAIGEVTIETYMEGRGENAREVKRIKVKPWNKLEAADKVLRHAGISKEKSPLAGAANDLVDRINAGMRRVSNVKEDD